MIRPSGWTRHAEEFDRALSGDPSAPEYDELLSVVAELRAVPDVTARPEFVASLRTQLIAAAEREPARAEQALAVKLTPRQRKGSRERRLAALVGGFAVVSATGSMAMAAQGALPGDALYPVKRAIENAETNLQPDDSSRADAVLSHAEARLKEAEKLVARGADGGVVSETLQAFVDQTEQASDLALDSYTATGQSDDITDLRSFARSSIDVLSALSPLVPDSARSMLITATQTVRQVDAAAWEACASCGDGALTEVPGLASMPLAELLRGSVPDVASVSQPVTVDTTRKKAVKQRDEQPTQAPTPDDTATPDTTTDDSTVLPDPTKVKGPVTKTVDEIGDRVDQSVDNAEDAATSDKSLTGKLVDGLTGVLGGLLGG